MNTLGAKPPALRAIACTKFAKLSTLTSTVNLGARSTNRKVKKLIARTN
jgi:hypothetical protein